MKLLQLIEWLTRQYQEEGDIPVMLGLGALEFRHLYCDTSFKNNEKRTWIVIWPSTTST